MQEQRWHAHAEHNSVCDAAEHHRMQPAPAIADYKLLREGAVAALQILYAEVVLLRRLVCTSVANKRPSTYVNAKCIFIAKIGELCCNQLQPTCCCNHDCDVCVSTKLSGKVCTSTHSNSIVTCPLTDLVTHQCIWQVKSSFHLGLTMMLSMKLFLAILCKIETPLHHVV